MFGWARTVSVFLLFGIQLEGSQIANAFEPSGDLEIHYINVGQGGATLIIGPNGTRVLYDFGNVSGGEYLIPYLQGRGITPEVGIDYAIVSHRDRDHYVGYKALIEAGYQVFIANYGSGSGKYSPLARTSWLDMAKKTLAGQVQPIPVGLRISLGDGAELIVVAANGRVWHNVSAPPPNENDRSIALFIRYGNFHYILDGDLGSGREACTEHDTHQKDLQTLVAEVLIRNELMDEDTGVDVMHVAHHGSESSTSAAYYNLMKPEVAVISVGRNQRGFLHPRVDVIDKVLLGPDRPTCVKAPPVKCLFQTEDGVKGESSTGSTSFSGLAVGNFRIVTDGIDHYTLYADGEVDEKSIAEIDRPPEPCGSHFIPSEGESKWQFPLDENRLKQVENSCKPHHVSHF